MNKYISSLTLLLAAACPLLSWGQNSLENDPAYLPIDKVLDLKTIRPEVSINLPRFLLQDAASELSSGTNSPLAGLGAELADLIKDVKLIRLVVIESKQTNRDALDKAFKTLRADLEAKWTTVVSVPEENVGIYALGDPSGDSMAGLALLVFDGDSAVIGNIIGRVSIGKLIKIASRTDKLPKDLLKKLQGLGNQSGTQPAATSASPDPKKPGEGPADPSKKANPK
jgi:hypothetical protein